MDKEFTVADPGGRFTPLGSVPAEGREDLLLNLAALDGPQAAAALVAYLSQPARVPAVS